MRSETDGMKYGEKNDDVRRKKSDVIVRLIALERTTLLLHSAL
jgi:hypothetical protein